MTQFWIVNFCLSFKNTLKGDEGDESDDEDSAPEPPPDTGAKQSNFFDDDSDDDDLFKEKPPPIKSGTGALVVEDYKKFFKIGALFYVAEGLSAPWRRYYETFAFI